MGCNAAINQNMAAIVSASGLRGEFLYFVLQHMYGPIREYGRGANQAALNCEQVAELRIPLPPVDEQRWITNGLQLETGKAHAMADRIRDSIAVLQEHRSALISAAVTGKIDVRTEGAEYGIRNKVKAV